MHHRQRTVGPLPLLLLVRPLAVLEQESGGRRVLADAPRVVGAQRSLACRARPRVPERRPRGPLEQSDRAPLRQAQASEWRPRHGLAHVSQLDLRPAQGDRPHLHRQGGRPRRRLERPRRQPADDQPVALDGAARHVLCGLEATGEGVAQHERRPHIQLEERQLLRGQLAAQRQRQCQAVAGRGRQELALPTAAVRGVARLHARRAQLLSRLRQAEGPRQVLAQQRVRHVRATRLLQQAHKHRRQQQRPTRLDLLIGHQHAR